MGTGFVGIDLSLVGQICSIIGMALTVGSMQCKRMKSFYAVQFTAAIAFIISYFLLQSLTGALFNLYGFIRAIILLLGKRCRHWGYFLFLMVLIVGCGFFCLSREGWLSLLPTTAQIFGTIGMWTRNGRKMRILQFCFVSPLWLIYNIVIFSLGGIGCEAFNMISVLVSVWRYGWSALGKEQE